MRVEFVKAVTQVFAEDERAVFLTGDLGYNALEALQKTYPRRFINAGVAEQNMVGVAAGLALAGYRPWVYSIAPFAVYRCLEQIRNDVCLHNLTVRLVGNGGGYTYGVMGSTHHALEDLGVLKTLPNMQLYFPCSGSHLQATVQQLQSKTGPAYVRLGISGFAQAQEPLSEQPQTLTRHYSAGSQLTVVGVGHAVHLALALGAEHNQKLGLDIFGLAQFPFDLQRDAAVVDSLRRTRRLLLLDEHYESGSIAQSLRTALPGAFTVHFACARYHREQTYGSAKHHLRQAQLDPPQLLQRIHQMLQGER
jgi:transketolase